MPPGFLSSWSISQHVYYNRTSLIDFIIKNFKNKYLYIMGDLNARCGTPSSMFHYDCNPDTTINSNGRKLLSLCSDNDLVLVNGLHHNGKTHDSKFTYFRGQLRTQNDWLISNTVTSLYKYCNFIQNTT